MNLSTSRFLCLLTIFLVLDTTFTLAQTQETQPPSAAAAAEAEREKARREEEKRRELEKKAIALLSEIAEAADGLKLSVNRVSVYGTVGALLWKFDEKRARNVINGAAQEIINAQNAASDEAEDSGGGNGYQTPEWEMQEARRQLAHALAPLDAEFALEIYRRTRSAEMSALMQSPKSLFPNGSDYNRVLNEINTEHALANEIARQDPKRAVRLAREILDKGLSYQLLELIDRLKNKEPEEASSLADEAVRKLQTADFSASYNDRNLAINFLTRLLPKPPADGDSGKEKSKFVVDESGLRSLADKLINFFLRDAQAESYSYQVAQLIPAAEKLLPSRVEQLRRRESEIKQRQARSNPYDRLNKLNETADAETLITEAQNAPSEVKSQYYSSAANKLINAETPNVERARAVINSIPDRRTRDYALQNLNTQLFYKAVSAGNIEEARRLVAQIKNKNAQVAQYVQLFNHLRQKKDEKLARQMLDEAAALAAVNPENREEVSAVVQLASAYSAVAPETSLALLEPLFARFNDLLHASILINRFSGGQPAVVNRADEITSQFFQGTLSQFGFYLSHPDLAKMAAADFDRTSNLANGLQRQEARIFVKLMLAQAVFAQFGNKTANITFGNIVELPVSTGRFRSLNE
jgi:hypothetical protein